jgi:hypothetical protein
MICITVYEKKQSQMLSTESERQSIRYKIMNINTQQSTAVECDNFLSIAVANWMKWGKGILLLTVVWSRQALPIVQLWVSMKNWPVGQHMFAVTLFTKCKSVTKVWRRFRHKFHRYGRILSHNIMWKWVEKFQNTGSTYIIVPSIVYNQPVCQKMLAALWQPWPTVQLTFIDIKSAANSYGEFLIKTSGMYHTPQTAFKNMFF